MIGIAETRWYELGIYRVLALPLKSNPYWQTFRIFRGDKFLGAQLSMPTITDAQWLERTGGVYATEEESHKHSAGWIVRPERKKAK